MTTARPACRPGCRGSGRADAHGLRRRWRRAGVRDRHRPDRAPARGARVDGDFSLVYLVYNTISNLVTQDAQVACFQNAAAHLKRGGRFVIENGVPALQSLPAGQTVLGFRADPEGFSCDVYDVVTQRFSSQHFYIVDGKVEAYPMEFRYAWPSDFDLMARLAGMSSERGDSFGGPTRPM